MRWRTGAPGCRALLHISHRQVLEPLVSGKLGYLRELTSHRILGSRLRVIASPQIADARRSPEGICRNSYTLLTVQSQ
jgi:hypothetical protein